MRDALKYIEGHDRLLTKTEYAQTIRSHPHLYIDSRLDTLLDEVGVDAVTGLFPTLHAMGWVGLADSNGNSLAGGNTPKSTWHPQRKNHPASTPGYEDMLSLKLSTGFLFREPVVFVSTLQLASTASYTPAVTSAARYALRYIHGHDKLKGRGGFVGKGGGGGGGGGGGAGGGGGKGGAPKPVKKRKASSGSASDSSSDADFKRKKKGAGAAGRSSA